MPRPMACATSIRSNGSRCGPGSRPARSASATVIGICPNPSPGDGGGNVGADVGQPAKPNLGRNFPSGSGAHDQVVRVVTDHAASPARQAGVIRQPPKKGMSIQQHPHERSVFRTPFPGPQFFFRKRIEKGAIRNMTPAFQGTRLPASLRLGGRGRGTGHKTNGRLAPTGNHDFLAAFGPGDQRGQTGPRLADVDGGHDRLP